VLTKDATDISYDLLVKLRDTLISYGKSLTGDSHY
jgi:hypothetical protein